MSTPAEMLQNMKDRADEQHVIRLAARLYVALWGMPDEGDTSTTKQLAAAYTRVSFEAAEIFVAEANRRGK